MKLKIIFTFLLIALSLNIFAKEMILRTDEGTITIDIPDAKDGKIKSDRIISLLKAKIDKLEYESIARLGTLERAEALKELKSIRVLIAALPLDSDIVIDGAKKDQADKEAEKKEMTDADFKLLIDNLKAKKFSREKIDVIKIAAENNYFTFSQLQGLLDQVKGSDSGDLITVIKTVYPKVTERKNNYLLLDYFRFQSDKDRVKKIMESIDKK